MEFVAILGDRGSFKSCFMTSLLAIDAREGREIVANYSLFFPPEYHVSKATFEEIAALAENSVALRGCSIGVDELGVGADSYDFMNKTPRKITALVAQLRKDRAIFYYNAQRFNTIALRLRDQTDAFFLCEDVDKLENPGPRHRETCKGIAHITQCDADLNTIREFYFDGKPWYNYYDTDEKQRKPRKKVIDSRTRRVIDVDDDDFDLPD